MDRSGHVVRLLGVNRSGPEYACQQGWGFFDGPSDMASIRAMKSWRINSVRVALNETCWLGINGVDPRYGADAYRRAIRSYVAKLERAGLYVILNLELAAPGGQQASSIPPMPDADHSPGFWRGVAAPSAATAPSSSTSTRSRTTSVGPAGSTAARSRAKASAATARRA